MWTACIYLWTWITRIRLQVLAVIFSYVIVPRPVLRDTQSSLGKCLVLEIIYAVYKRISVLDVSISIEIEPLYAKQFLSLYFNGKYT
jgi:hypothetical protein